MRRPPPRALPALASLGLLLALGVSACGGVLPEAGETLPFDLQVPTAQIDSPPDEASADDATPGPSAPPSPAAPGEEPPPRPPTHARYTLDVLLDYARHRLTVEQGVEYTNASTETIGELLLVVEPQRHSKVFELNRLAWGDGEPVGDFRLKGGLLRISLPEGLPPGESLRLALEYELNLPAQSSPFGYGARQVNLSNWYPSIPPYIPGQGWLAHEPGEVGEHLSYEPADFEVTIGLAEPDGKLSIAAPVPAQRDGETFRYRLEGARAFAWAAGREFERLEASAGEITLAAYVYPEHRRAGQAALEVNARALALYAELFGPCPYSHLTVVEIDYWDGLESDGLYFLGQDWFASYYGTPGNYLTILAAHETSHQWWYAKVGNDQALEPWLDETLATYSELLYYERYYPDLVDWWWDFRVRRYDLGGAVNGSIYDFDKPTEYVPTVYLNGARFIHELRQLVGEEAFFAFLRDYAQRGNGKLMEGGDFFTLLAQHSPADHGDLLERYFAP